MRSKRTKRFEPHEDNHWGIEDRIEFLEAIKKDRLKARVAKAEEKSKQAEEKLWDALKRAESAELEIRQANRRIEVLDSCNKGLRKELNAFYGEIKTMKSKMKASEMRAKQDEEFILFFKTQAYPIYEAVMRDYKRKKED